MNITRDVVTDLLPLYLAGEASEDTRVLIEEYLRQNPAFGSTIREHTERMAALLETTVSPAADHEKMTLERVRRFNRYRMQLLAFSIAWTLLPLAFVFENSRIRWMMLRDNPKQAIMFWIAAAGCWLAYYLVGRRLRTTL